MSNEVQVHGQMDGLMPVAVRDKMQLANIIAKSGIAPRSLDTPEKVYIALQWGHELGLSPMAAVNNINAINGKVTMSADLMMGLCMSHPQYAGKDEQVTGDGENLKARVVIRRRHGDIVDEHVGEFSWREAVAAGLTSNDVWKKYAKRMVAHRARAFAARNAFPDVLAGLYTHEEVESIPPEEPRGQRNVTPPPTEPEPPAGPTEEELDALEKQLIKEVDDAKMDGLIDDDQRQTIRTKLTEAREKGALPGYTEKVRGRLAAIRAELNADHSGAEPEEEATKEAEPEEAELDIY